LQYNYEKKDEGFPFKYTCMVEYKLTKNNSLTIKTSVKNNAETSMPVCDGWHPYFNLGASINTLMFELNSHKMLEFNEKLVPAGNILPYQKFQQPEIFGDAFLDNCFLLNENNKAACVLKNVQSGLQLTICADASYPYLQLYTPEHRKSVAIENLSAAPDAFNNKTGLTILKPKQSKTFQTTYKVSFNHK
ncbi:MAG: aldose 1-epimerase, partial [Parafilimonas sp.]|nr:aldose 1-epimerase [Parafilimonas sp.]